MKKKLTITIGTVVAMGILGFGLLNTNAHSQEPSLTTDEIRNIVGKQYPGHMAEPKLVTEGKRPVYEVGISNDDKAYHLKLDGNSGEVLNIAEKPVQNPTPTKQDDKKENQEKRNNEPIEQKETKTVISPEEAGKIALSHFDGKIEQIELDTEDGRLIYEVEIERGEQEAEVEIDAYTGEVIVIEIEED